MPYPHPIRLHGPWEFQALPTSALPVDSGAVPKSGPTLQRLRIPCDWGDLLSADFHGRVRFRRGFNSPTQLDRHEHVWLVCEGVDPAGTVTLNGQLLGNVRGYALPAEFDVTSLIGPRNELQIDIDWPFASGGANSPPRPGRERLPGGIVGEVRLEIRTTLFIEGLSLHFQRLTASSDDPTSEIADESVLQGTIRGESTGERFEIVATGPAGELIYGEVPAGEHFELHGVVEGIPPWRDGTAEPGPGAARLAEVEIRLLQGGTRLWEAWLHTALPATWCESTQQLDQIDERRLAEYDLAGIAVVQSLPIEWANTLCPRLAHHPCIAAWGALADGSGNLTVPGHDALYYGRPWIDLGRALSPSGDCG